MINSQRSFHILNFSNVSPVKFNSFIRVSSAALLRFIILTFKLSNWSIALYSLLLKIKTIIIPTIIINTNPTIYSIYFLLTHIHRRIFELNKLFKKTTFVFYTIHDTMFLIEIAKVMVN